MLMNGMMYVWIILCHLPDKGVHNVNSSTFFMEDYLIWLILRYSNSREIQLMKSLLKCAFITAFMTTVLLLSAQTEELQVQVEITTIQVGGGNLYIAIYNSSDSMKKENPFRKAMIDDRSASKTLEFSLPPGDYVVSVFQDENNNGKLDSNFIGIPKEPVGLSNYEGGIPGNFDKLKTTIHTRNTRMTVSMVEI